MKKVYVLLSLSFLFFVISCQKPTENEKIENEKKKDGKKELSAPTNLTASDGTYMDKVDVIWGAVVGAEKYMVYRSVSSSGTYQEVGTATNNIFNDTAVSPGVTYYYKAQASDVYSNSDYSNVDAGFSSVSPPDEKILFIRGATDLSAHSLYRMNTDGTNIELIYNGKRVSNAHYSYDKSKICFSSQDSSTTLTEVFIINSDGTGIQQITSAAATYGCSVPSWHPLENKIWFRVGYGSSIGQSQFGSVNIDGTGFADLTSFSQPVAYPGLAFAADGSKVYYAKANASSAGTEAIYKANLDFSGEVQIVTAKSCAPSVSSNGAKIVYINGNYQSIYTANNDGTGQFNLVTVSGAEYVYEPRYSSNGTKVIFTKFDGSQYDIYIINSDGTNMTNVTNTPTNGEQAWDWK